MLPASSQLESRVLLVPPPVQETLKRPCSRRGCRRWRRTRRPPCSWPMSGPCVVERRARRTGLGDARDGERPGGIGRPVAQMCVPSPGEVVPPKLLFAVLVFT